MAQSGECVSCHNVCEEENRIWKKNRIVTGTGLRTNYKPFVIKLLLLMDLLAWGSYFLFYIEPSKIALILRLILFAFRNFLVIMVVALAAVRMFYKAGIKGWKALIPVINLYYALKIANNSGWFITISLLSIPVAFLFDGSETFIIVIIIILLDLILYIKFLYGISVRYGHGVPYTIGLLLFPLLFIVCLGWSSDPAADAPYEVKSKGAQGLNATIYGLLSFAILFVVIRSYTPYLPLYIENTKDSWNTIFKQESDTHPLELEASDSEESNVEKQPQKTSIEITQEWYNAVLNAESFEEANIYLCQDEDITLRQEMYDSIKQIGAANISSAKVLETRDGISAALISYSADTSSDTQYSFLMYYEDENNNIVCCQDQDLRNTIINAHLCTYCGGSGSVASGGMTICPICNGIGQQYIPNLYYDAVMGWTGGYIVCSGCGGSGQTGSYSICTWCAGTGIR